ncbi:MAG: ABC transporter ATP-binding protein [Pseudomonadota bacterium]|nr:ABC transporter ATP-binding protein [Pseudomonadota bacterium]MEC8977808.1 ABC transporter ATP-binding protein [Pseudomonadota bacterium]
MSKNVKLPENLLEMIWYFSKPMWYWLVSIFVVTFAFAVLNTFLSYALKEVIDALESASKVHLLHEVMPACLFFAGSYIGVCGSLRLRNLCSLYFYPRLSRTMTEYLHELLQRRPYRYYQEQMTGSIANRVIELNTGTGVIIELATQTWFVLSLISVYTYLLWSESPYFAYVFIFWLSLFIPYMLYCSSKARGLAYGVAKSQTDLMGTLVDCINNMYFVKLFARQFHEQERISTASVDVLTKDVALKGYLLRLRFTSDLMLMLLMGSNLALLLYLYQKNQITIGVFAFVIDTTVEVSWYVLDYFGEQCLKMVEEYGKCQQALTLLHAPWQVQEDKNHAPLVVSDGTVSFDNFSFSHTGATPLFKDFNLTIKGGERVGLVGFSGSGKTTLLQLLLRFFKVEKGAVRIDGEDIQHVSLESLRKMIAMIPQDSQLFHRSILENIRYGDLQATDEAVVEAAKKAHAHDFIEQLPDGYQTMVGERGLKLSGGQRQRLAIARAFLKESPILLLDEATSALDTVTEQAIYHSLQDLMLGKTAIVIAHRLSTIKSLDRIIVLDHGRIVEEGKHNDLIKKKDGYYWKMWQVQAEDDLLVG